MLDTENKVAEATGANIFCLSRKEIMPPVPDSFLDGILEELYRSFRDQTKIIERLS